MQAYTVFLFAYEHLAETMMNLNVDLAYFEQKYFQTFALHLFIS